jgi:hypothetical protein
LRPRQRGERIDAERPRDHQQLDDIDTALASFIFRHKALRLPERCGQFLLRDIRPNGNQRPVTVSADNQINARLMIEAQNGRGSIISGPNRLDLMRAI